MPSVARLSYAVLLSAFLLLLTSPIPSTALSNSVHQPHIARGAQHAAAGAKRRMEKRLGILPTDTQDNPTDQQANANQNAADNQATPAGTTNQQGNVQPAQNNNADTNTNTQNNNANSNTADSNNGSVLGGLVGNNPAASGTSSSATSSASSTPLSSTVSSTATLSTVSATSTTSTPTIDINSNTATSSHQASTVSYLSTVSAMPTQTADASNSSTNANTFGKNTIIAIAVIAGSIGGAAAIWTLIRKWKLGPSARFEDRMQPIEWSPDGDASLAGPMREKDAAGIAAGASGVGRRPTSTGSAGSFHSGDASHNNLGRNVTGNGNMFAEQDVPPHDFTAGATQGGYGPNPYDYDYNAHNPNAGYVDLHRNVSSGGNLARGPSNGAYGNGYGYEHQHQAHAGQDDAYAQDAYGGYETQPQPQYAHDAYGDDGRAAQYNYQGARY